MAATSAPQIEKITNTIPVKIGSTPFGAKPPASCINAKPLCSNVGNTPKIIKAPTTKNTMIAPTLINANQYSNSPNVLTEYKLMAVSSSVIPTLPTHTGIDGTHECSMPPITAASKPTMNTQLAQYNQPTV